MKLKQFINSIECPAPLMDAVMIGYNSLFEGYSDVVINRSINDAFENKKEFSSSISPAMSVINRSQRSLGSLYSEDTEPFLDKLYTSYVASMDPETYEYEPTGDIHEDSLGLTARDLTRSSNPKPVKKQQTQQIARKRHADTLDLSSLI